MTATNKPHAETALVAKCAKYGDSFPLDLSKRPGQSPDPGQHTGHVMKNISYIIFFSYKQTK